MTGVPVKSWSMNWPHAITMLLTSARRLSAVDTLVEMRRGDGSGFPATSLVRGRLPAKWVGHGHSLHSLHQVLSQSASSSLSSLNSTIKNLIYLHFILFCFLLHHYASPPPPPPSPSHWFSSSPSSSSAASASESSSPCLFLSAPGSTLSTVEVLGNILTHCESSREHYHPLWEL